MTTEQKIIRPFRSRGIACKTKPVALISGTSDFGPTHGALHRIIANPTESHPAEITHCFFGQALRMKARLLSNR
jgi:hypothetical protein